MTSQSAGRTALKIEHLSVLATVVVAFSASTALILSGQSELRRDMWAGQSEIRKDMRAGQAELRKDMRTGQAELRAGQAELRKEMQAGQAELRKEMRAGQAELRKEMQAGQAGIREDLKSLDARLAVVEQRTAGLSAETDASAAGAAPAALLDGQADPPRATLLRAKPMAAEVKSVAVQVKAAAAG